MSPALAGQPPAGMRARARRAAATARRALYALGILDEEEAPEAKDAGNASSRPRARSRGAGDPDEEEGVELLAAAAPAPAREEEEKEKKSKEDESKKKKMRLAASMHILWGFIWPAGERLVRLLTLGLIFNTVLHQTMAIARPLLYKVLMDQLQRQQFRPTFVFVYGMWFWIIHLTGQAKWLNYRKLEQGITRSINERTVAQLYRLPVAYHIEHTAAKSISAMERGTAAVLGLLDVISNVIAPAFFDVTSLLSIFLVGYPPVYAIVLFLTAAAYATWTWLVSKRAEKLRKALGEKQSRPSEVLNDALTNCEAMKLFCAEGEELRKFKEAFAALQRHTFREALFSSLFLGSGQVFIIMFGLSIMMLFAARDTARGTFTIGDFVLVNVYVWQIFGPLGSLGSAWTRITQARADMGDLWDLLAMPGEAAGPPGAAPLAAPACPPPLHVRLSVKGARRGDVEFRDVWFSYHKEKPADGHGDDNSDSWSSSEGEGEGEGEGEKADKDEGKDEAKEKPGGAGWALRGVSFAAPAGSTVALVGHTGSGKSSVVRLLLRLWDVDRGSVLVDGRDVREVPVHSLRSAIGVVSQDAVLLNDTVRANVAYGACHRRGQEGGEDADGAVAPGEVESAARRAAVHDAVARLPKGYETKVGNRGLALSGGERQRVCIARVMVKDPRIVVLDEATAALDVKTEDAVKAALREVSRARTCLVVAHRLSTVVDADLILVMKRGRIVERGTHAGLLARPGGAYASLWRRQIDAAAAAAAAGHAHNRGAAAEPKLE